MLDNNLDSIFFISEHGKKYFESTYGLRNEKNTVSRLGIINNYPFNPGVPEQEYFRIITCSNLIGVKRVHLVIKALEKVKSSKRIIWNHFGEGPLMMELIEMAEKTLKNTEKIESKFSGQVHNADIMKFYSENYVDLFINTSSSEGVPVSFMEAQSFGIPVIATDTGGTGEIVGKDTGFLLSVDFEIEDLARQIEYLLNLEQAEKVRMRKVIHDNWSKNFNAYSNFNFFVQQITDLSASAER
jgi:glycosyltransferase involved in cell wall biosynthesis